MKCKDVINIIEQDILDNLTDDQRMNFKNHLSECKNCDDLYEASANVKDLSKELKELNLLLNEDLSQQILASVETKTKSVINLYSHVLFKVFAVASVFFFGFFLFEQIYLLRNVYELESSLNNKSVDKAISNIKYNNKHYISHELRNEDNRTFFLLKVK